MKEMARRGINYRCLFGVGVALLLCWLSYWFFFAPVDHSNDLFKADPWKSGLGVPDTMNDRMNQRHGDLNNRRQNSPVDSTVNYDGKRRIDGRVISRKTAGSQKKVDSGNNYKKYDDTHPADSRYSDDMRGRQVEETGKTYRGVQEATGAKRYTDIRKFDNPTDDDDLSWIEVERKTDKVTKAPIRQRMLNPVSKSVSTSNMDNGNMNDIPFKKPVRSGSQTQTGSLNGLSSPDMARAQPQIPTLRPWKRDEADELPAGTFYSLIHNGVISRVKKTVPSDESPHIEGVSSDLYVFRSKSLPKNRYLRPSVGNGIVGTIVRSSEVYMSGLYNGLGAQSHRAAIPSTSSFNITHTDPPQNLSRTYTLNMAAGIYSETLRARTWNVTYRLYAHRTISGLIVTEVDLVRSRSRGAELKLMIDVDKWKPPYDLTFVEKDSGMEEVSYKVGKTKSPEHLDEADMKVHVLYDHVPSQLSPPSSSSLRTKWVFLSVYGTSRDEVFNLYNRSVSRMHGRDELYRRHVGGWLKLWNSARIDLTSEEPDDLSQGQAIYSAWYSLLSSLPLRKNDLFVGLSGTGLAPHHSTDSNRLHTDHVTWEQEMLMYPPLLLFHQTSAWNILSSRLRLSAGAMLNAQLAGVRGVAFPSRSGATGIELHENGTQSCTRSPHVSAGVAWSVLQWVYTTGNSSVVTRGPYNDLLTNISHFLISRAFLEQDHYSIKDVLPPDSSHGAVTNSPYVNGVMSLALSAIGYIHALERQVIDQWNVYSERIVQRYDAQLRIHPAFDGYQPNERVREADAVLLAYPLMMKHLEEGSRRSDLEFYEQRLETDVSPWSLAMHAIGWLELNETVKAQQNFLKLIPLVNNPFKVWTSHSVVNASDTSSQVTYNHLPTAAAFLQSVINGYAGIRLGPDRLILSPILPPHTSSLYLQGLQYRGHRIVVNITADYMMVRASALDAEHSTQLMLYVYNTTEQHLLNDSTHSVRVQRRKVYISAVKSKNQV